MMNSARVFHFRLTGKQWQDLQLANAFFQLSSSIFLNVEDNLQQSVLEKEYAFIVTRFRFVLQCHIDTEYCPVMYVLIQVIIFLH